MAEDKEGQNMHMTGAGQIPTLPRPQGLCCSALGLHFTQIYNSAIKCRP